MADSARFKGGTKTAREKLNKLLEDGGDIRGDGKYITVRKTKGGGCTITLNVQQILQDIPKLRTPSGGAMDFVHFTCIVKGNGGSQWSGGAPSTPASWEYDVYALTDGGFVTKLNLAGAIQPKCSRARQELGLITAAADGTEASCYYDDGGAIQIFDLQEFGPSTACS